MFVIQSWNKSGPNSNSQSSGIKTVLSALPSFHHPLNVVLKDISFSLFFFFWCPQCSLWNLGMFVMCYTIITAKYDLVCGETEVEIFVVYSWGTQNFASQPHVSQHAWICACTHKHLYLDCVALVLIFPRSRVPLNLLTEDSFACHFYFCFWWPLAIFSFMESENWNSEAIVTIFFHVVLSHCIILLWKKHVK